MIYKKNNKFYRSGLKERLFVFVFIGFFMVFYCLVFASTVHALTVYVDPESPSPGSGYRSWETAAHTIHQGINSMSGGDVLIIRDGIYTGSANMMYGVSIPSGTAGNYTVVKAETDFNVTIDNESVSSRKPFSQNTNYLEVHGILFGRAGDSAGGHALITSGDNVKFFRVGAYDASPVVGNTQDMPPTFYISKSSNVLIEECYSYGWGRYQFSAYMSNHVIFRRSIARQDGWLYGKGSCFQNYGSKDVEYQNCIAIDFDEPRHWHSGTGSQWGGFGLNSVSERVYWRGCIVVNIRNTQGVAVGGDQKYLNKDNMGWRIGGSISTPFSLDNCVIVHANTGFLAYNDLHISNCTFVNIFDDPKTDYSRDGDVFWSASGASTVKNSLFVNIEDSAAYALTGSSGYNAYFNNGNNYEKCSPQANDISSENGNEENVLWSMENPSGGLKYPIRIEPGSNLSGKGDNGADIGANIVKMYGKSGTFYGEPGYNVLTETDLWPFPNEDKIRDKMRVYQKWDPNDNIDPGNPSNPATYVNGKRGFCADGMTLTSYVFGMLGNSSDGSVPPETNLSPKEVTNFRME
jgi:hypothetical protein